MVRVWNREQDYDTLVSWWKAHKWEALPAIDIPDTGYIANECAFGCLYIDIHLRFAMLEWVVTDPKTNGKELVASLHELMDKLLATAKEVGVKRVYSVLKHKGLIRLYQKHGFVKGDTQVCDMIWVGE